MAMVGKPKAETKERNDQIVAMKLADPSLSGGQIARDMGLSRNTVLAVLARRIADDRVRGHNRSRKDYRTPFYGCFLGASRARIDSLMRQTAPGLCRYPFGDPKAHEFRFCCEKVVHGPYCAKHAAICYRSAQGEAA
ncbi:MAG: GcrA family cell cycle regulator [Pseudomonadota bacterium]